MEGGAEGGGRRSVLNTISRRISSRVAFSQPTEKGSDAKIVENVHSRVASQSEENAKRSVGEATPVVSTRFEFGVGCDAPATAPGAPRDRARASSSHPPSRRACVSSSRGQTHLADVAHGPGVGAERDALVLGNHGVGGVDAAGAGRIKGGRGEGARVSSRSRRDGTSVGYAKQGHARRCESSARFVARRVAAHGPAALAKREERNAVSAPRSFAVFPASRAHL